MLNRKDLLDLTFYKKSPFTGSLGDLRYRLEKADVPEDTPLGPYTPAPPAEAAETPEGEEGAEAEEIPMKSVLLLTTWPGPFAFDTTDDEKKEKALFEFSEEGMNAVTDFLNAKAEEVNAR